MDICKMIELLVCQQELQERILALSYEKRKALLDNDTEGLDTLVQQERKQLTEMGKLEKRRLALICQIALDLGMEEDEITLSHLCSLAEEEQATRLAALGNSLAHILAEQKELNARNRELLEVHIDYTETALNLMMPNQPLSHIYGAGGSTYEDEVKTPGLFDTQI